MPHWLKRGMDAGAIKVADAKVYETVEHNCAPPKSSARRKRTP